MNTKRTVSTVSGKWSIGWLMEIIIHIVDDRHPYLGQATPFEVVTLSIEYKRTEFTFLNARGTILYHSLFDHYRPTVVC